MFIDAWLSTFSCWTLLSVAILTRLPRRPIRWVIMAGVAAGSTVSIKFTGCGVAVTLVIGIFMHFPLIQAIVYSAVAALVGLVVFITSFWVHFKLLWYEGPGCIYHMPHWCRMMSRGQVSVFDSIIMLIQQMLASNFAISVSHSYSSKWWQWPLMLGFGTYLYVKDDVYLWTIGSPAVW
jgi:dolichyl-phosphate-mannose--protein O-mannosyl transferase